MAKRQRSLHTDFGVSLQRAFPSKTAMGRPHWTQERLHGGKGACPLSTDWLSLSIPKNGRLSHDIASPVEVARRHPKSLPILKAQRVDGSNIYGSIYSPHSAIMLIYIIHGLLHPLPLPLFTNVYRANNWCIFIEQLIRPGMFFCKKASRIIRALESFFIIHPTLMKKGRK